MQPVGSILCDFGTKQSGYGEGFYKKCLLSMETNGNSNSDVILWQGCFNFSENSGNP